MIGIPRVRNSPELRISLISVAISRAARIAPSLRTFLALKSRPSGFHVRKWML